MTITTTAEQIAEGVTREWRHEKRMVLYTMSDVRRETVDAYIDDNKQVIRQWDASKIFYNLHDGSDPSIALTPYFRQRLNETADLIRERGITSRGAIVVPDTLLFRIFMIFGDFFARRANEKKVIQRYFTRREDAILWLERMMADER